MDGIVLTLAALKLALKITHSDADTFLSEIIEDVEAEFQRFTGRRLTSAARTDYIDGGALELQVEHWPMAAGGVVAITDTHNDDEAVPTTDYQVDELHGIITKPAMGMPTRWGVGLRRWKVTYTGGLPAHPDWTAVIEPHLRRSFRDYGVVLYERRNAAVTGEDFGGGVGVTYDEEELPKRIQDAWERYAEIVV